MPTDTPALLADACAILGQNGIDYAVIGGCARNAYAEVRPTKDVDFVVAADAAAYASLVAVFARHGFRPATTVGGPPDAAVPDLELFRDDRGRRIDLLFAHTDFEKSALARKERPAPYGQTEVPVVSPEDLIVYKLIAGRTQDRLDILAMLDALVDSGRSIDWAYVERWCVVWEISDRLARLRQEQADAADPR